MTHSAKSRCLTIVMMISAGFLSGTPAAWAQQAETESERDLEEIVVTARKRAESLFAVPVAVTAFSSEQLQNIGTANMVELSKFTAGLQFNEQGVAEPGRMYTSIRFRGLGSELKQPFAQTGSAFLDGVYMAGGVSSLGTEEFERIEVVKGPSAAWLGRSTFAGAINFVSKKPNLHEYAGRVTAKYAQDETYDMTFSHTGPIVEDLLGYRVYLRGYGTGGQYIASDGGAMGAESTNTFVGALTYEPTDALSLTVRAIISEDDDGPPAQAFVSGPLGRRANDIGVSNCFAKGVSSPDLYRLNDPALGNLTDFICGQVPNDLRFVDSTTIVPPEALDFWNNVVPQTKGAPKLQKVGLLREQERFMLLGDYAIDARGWLRDATVSVLAAYNDENVNYIRDSDQTEVPNWLSSDPQRHSSSQLEARITSGQETPLTWLLGVSYFDAEFEAVYGTGESILGTDGGILCGSTANPLDPARDLDTALGRPADGISPCYSPPLGKGPINGAETLGVFGQFGYRFSDAWSVDFEWRWQQDDITVVLEDDLEDFPEPVQAFATGNGSELGDSFTTFLPRVTLQHFLDDSTNLWATFSRGNNPGFFNADIVSRPVDEVLIITQAVDTNVFISEEELDNYELGMRKRFWGNRGRLALVAYHMEWTNQKTRTSTVLRRPDGAELAATLVVAGFNSEFNGIELESAIALTPELTMDAMINWADAEYKNFECGFTDDYQPAQEDGRLFCNGNRPVQFPEWSGALAFTWQDSFRGDWDYFLRLDGTYTGKRYVDEANFAYLGEQTLVNFRVGFANDLYRIEGFVTNLFNDKSWNNGGRFSDFSADRGTRTPLEFSLQQGISLAAPNLRQVGVRFAYDF